MHSGIKPLAQGLKSGRSKSRILLASDTIFCHSWKTRCVGYLEKCDMKVVNHGLRDGAPFLLIVAPSPSIFAILSWRELSSSSCARPTYRPWPHLISTPSFMCLRLFHTAKAFYLPLFMPVVDTCRRGGGALACAGHQESWPGLGLLGNRCSLLRRGGEGKMRLSYWGHAAAGARGVWGCWTTSQEHRKVQVRQCPRIWTGSFFLHCVGRHVCWGRGSDYGS